VYFSDTFSIVISTQTSVFSNRRKNIRQKFMPMKVNKGLTQKTKF